MKIKRGRACVTFAVAHQFAASLCCLLGRHSGTHRSNPYPRSIAGLQEAGEERIAGGCSLA